MKKIFFTTISTITLSIACLNVQAMSIDVTTMKTYDGSGASVIQSGGLNTSVVGSVNSDGNGAFDYGTTPFLGTPWFATQVMANEITGSLQNWSGTSAAGSFSYDYTLAAGQIATGIYMDWGVTQDIAILAVFDCGVGTVGSFCSSVDTDGIAPLGTVMQNGPFAGDNITFAFEGTVSAVPVPAAVWLFGSGLIGLIGVARRKKA